MHDDTLSEVLRGVRLRGAIFFYVSGNSGWVAEAPPAREIAPLLIRGVGHVMEYHVVTAGSCWAGIPGGASVQLHAGDIVLFPHGDAHVVSSAPGMRGTTDFGWLAAPGARERNQPVARDTVSKTRMTIQLTWM